MLTGLLAIAGLAFAQPIPPVNGPVPVEPTHAVVMGAIVHAAPGRTLDKAAIEFRDGVIVSVLPMGEEYAPPAGARVIDASGLHVYPAFIDPFVEVDAPAPDPAGPGAHWNSKVTPQRSALDGAGLAESDAQALRALGFGAAGLSPRGGIFRGSGAVVSLAREGSRPGVPRVVYDPMTFQMVSFETGGGFGRRRPATPGAPTPAPAAPVAESPWPSSPNSQMGAISLIRQTFRDADWLAREDRSERDGPSCLGALTRDTPVLFVADDELQSLRAGALAREASRRAIIMGSGSEYQRLDAIQADGLPLILPIAFPRAPDVASVGKADAVELRELMAWEQAPTNPRRVDAAGIKASLTTARLRDRAEFRDNLLKAIKHGLPGDRALEMLTTRPASLLGVESQLGTIEPGKRANFIIADGDLFDAWGRAPASDEAPKPDAPDAKPEGEASENPSRPEPKGAKIRDVWIDGRRHEINAAPDATAQGTWSVRMVDGEALDPAAPDAVTFVVSENAVTYLRSGKRATARNVRISGAHVSYTLDAKELFEIDATLMDQAVVSGDAMVGVTPMPDGTVHRWSAVRTSTSTELPPDENRPRRGRRGGGEGEPPADAREGGAPPDRPADQPTDAPEREKTPEEREREAIAAIPETLGYPFGPYMLASLPPQSPTVIRHATIWTSGPAGKIEDGSILLIGGTIAAVGTESSIADVLARIRLSEPLVEIDATGMHVTPGLIDCHSHTGISGGVNEFGQAVTAEVRIQDVTDPNSINWYRQLAGGTTCVNNLHGSANPIGGQNCVNKIRWGVPHPDQMHLEGAPPGIKFALGENVKQSNGDARERTRYPQTRMGVEAIIRDRFIAARRWADDPDRAPDLELEALAEILAGKRLVHCHSYRQDEILMLARLSREFGFKLGTYQHGLECYKVAREVGDSARGASLFADWWAYKIEVQDAIPQAGPILHEQGVVVSYNSDSDELARRMNTEASKAVKYGGLSPEEALKFVTINPAIQLGVESMVGSLEVGKHADVVLWNGDPLSAFSRCVATYVDGRRLFSEDDDLAHRTRIAAERHRIIQKILASGNSGRSGGGQGGPRRRPTDEREAYLQEAFERHMLERIRAGADLDSMLQGDCGCEQMSSHGAMR